MENDTARMNTSMAIHDMHRSELHPDLFDLPADDGVGNN